MKRRVLDIILSVIDTVVWHCPKGGCLFTALRGEHTEAHAHLELAHNIPTEYAAFLAEVETERVCSEDDCLDFAYACEYPTFRRGILELAEELLCRFHATANNYVPLDDPELSFGIEPALVLQEIADCRADQQ